MDFMVPLGLTLINQILHVLMDLGEATGIRLLRDLNKTVVNPRPNTLQASRQRYGISKTVPLVVKHSFAVFMVSMQPKLSRKIVKMDAHMGKRYLPAGSTESRGLLISVFVSMLSDAARHPRCTSQHGCISVLSLGKIRSRGMVGRSLLRGAPE